MKDLWEELEKIGCPHNDIENAIKWLDIEIGHLGAKVEKLERLRDALEDEKKRLDPKYVKVLCPNCLGYGLENKDNSKVECGLCEGRGYIWAVRIND